MLNLVAVSQHSLSVIQQQTLFTDCLPRLVKHHSLGLKLIPLKVQSHYSVWHQRMRAYAHTLANADIR